MSTPSLKKTILEKVQLFHAKCEKERNDILQRDREEKRKEEEKEERKQHLQNKFNETILKDLKALFDELTPLFSTPYIDIVLESHGHSNIFYLHDREKVPAFAFFGVDAISREGQEAFYRARYLLFAMSTSGNSFDLFVKNENRMLSSGERDDDESIWVQSYVFDNYNFDEIQQHIEKYLIEELSY